MDMYGQQHAAQDLFRIDDLLDFSNDDLFTSSSAAAAAVMSSSDPLPTNNPASDPHRQSSYGPISSGDFSAEDLYVPKDDVAELEWLSQFVDDSFTEFPANEIAGGVSSRQDAPYHGRSRSKRNRAASAWVFTSEPGFPTTSAGKSKKKESYPAEGSGGDGTPTGGVRRCTHCASEKTPQWRTGPLGPKSLCNACGVRFKSGRLVPEYRPAASPTFELTQHSNSHRKVMELRRQKEILQQEDQTQRQQQLQYHRHHQNFEVC